MWPFPFGPSKEPVSLLTMSDEEHPRAAGTAIEFAVSACLLPAIRDKYASNFDLLEIPEVLRIDDTVGPHGTVFFRGYQGRKYNDKWSEQEGSEEYGGRTMGAELSSEMIQLIGDLRKISVAWITRYPVGKRVSEVSFNLDGWLNEFRDRKPLCVACGLSEGELERAEELIREGFECDERVFNNGDFYPRNLIKTERRIVLVDWGYWPGSRACFIDHLPNVVAFAFVHMWGNRDWQAEFLGKARNALGISVDDLRRAILIKSFEQACFWKNLPRLFPQQVEHFRMAIEDRLPTN